MNKSYVATFILLISVLVSGLILYFFEINKSNTYEINEEYVDGDQIETEEISIDEDIEIYEDDNKKPYWELFTDKKYGYEYLRLFNDTYHQGFDIHTFNSTSTLDTFVKEFWNFNKVETYKKVTISNNESYQFFLDTELRWPVSWSRGIGISFNGVKNLVTVIDNGAGVKIIVIFPYDDEEYKKMFESLRVDKNLIPKKANPSDWTEITGLGFSFKYPANLFKPAVVPEELSTSNIYYYTLDNSEEGVYGGVSILVKNKKFDPTNIVGIYGVVENPKVVKMGDRNAYRYLEGDAGCGHQKVLTALGEDKTLEILFSSCHDYVYPLYQEEELIQSILDTFEFKK
jgi:hypothetical protein